MAIIFVSAKCTKNEIHTLTIPSEGQSESDLKIPRWRDRTLLLLRSSEPPSENDRNVHFNYSMLSLSAEHLHCQIAAGNQITKNIAYDRKLSMTSNFEFPSPPPPLPSPLTSTSRGFHALQKHSSVTNDLNNRRKSIDARASIHTSIIKSRSFQTLYGKPDRAQPTSGAVWC